jgi:hypothetical protein
MAGNPRPITPEKMDRARRGPSDGADHAVHGVVPNLYQVRGTAEAAAARADAEFLCFYFNRETSVARSLRETPSEGLARPFREFAKPQEVSGILSISFGRAAENRLDRS